MDPATKTMFKQMVADQARSHRESEKFAQNCIKIVHDVRRQAEGSRAEIRAAVEREVRAEYGVEMARMEKEYKQEINRLKRKCNARRQKVVVVVEDEDGWLTEREEDEEMEALELIDEDETEELVGSAGEKGSGEVQIPSEDSMLDGVGEVLREVPGAGAPIGHEMTGDDEVSEQGNAGEYEVEASDDDEMLPI